MNSNGDTYLVLVACVTALLARSIAKGPGFDLWNVGNVGQLEFGLR